MSETNFSSLFNPGQNFIENSYRAATGPVDNIIIGTGIVLDVLREVNLDAVSNLSIPQYSIKAKVIGEDVVTETDNDFSSDLIKWYTPLLPIHNISIPELGEEVTIIRESSSTDSKGYWIARVNNTSWVNANVAGDGVGDIGLNINTARLNAGAEDIQPNNRAKITAIPALLGDVIQQGRAKTFIRHSFNPIRRKKGVLEMGILEERFYPLKDTIPTIGKTSTKTVHIEGGNLNDLGTIKKFDPPTTTVFTPSGFPRQIRDDAAVRNYIANIADETYTISLEPDAEPALHQHVLGNKLVTYEENFGLIMADTLDKLGELVSTMGDFLNHFLDHTHGIPEINIQIPEKEVSFLDFRRDRPTFTPRPPIQRIIPSVTTRAVVKGPATMKETWDPITETVVRKRVRSSPQIIPIFVPARTITIPQAPITKPGKLRVTNRKKKIKYEEITIGGEENERNTTSPETSAVTTDIDDALAARKDEFAEQINELTTLLSTTKDILSKRHYIN
jgi:hypothetical protein